MFRARTTPPLSYMLDDLLTHDLHVVASHLDVSLQTLKRWKQAEQAPRAVMLALFYETRWGYSLIETTAHNDAMYARQQAKFLRLTITRLEAKIKRLEATGDFGAANDHAVGP